MTVEEEILRDILSEIAELRRAVEKLKDSVERLSGVGRFTADLHDLRNLLEQIEKNTGG